MRGRETGIRHCRACHDKSGVSACVAKAGGDGSRLEIMRASKACESDEDAQAGTSRKARLHPFPVFVLFCPVIAGKPGRPSGAGARPFPVFILELTATSRVLGCGGCPAFLLLFTGSGLWTAHETRRWSRRLSLAATSQGPQAAARAIPVRAGTGRPHRRSRRVRSR